MQTSTSKYKLHFLFGIISLVYIVTRLIIFKGFNGTDDLHYAMLAGRMVKGTYSPFVPGDIFSGRVLLIAWQALIYRIAGISVFTTQVTTLIAVLLSCYIAVFYLLRAAAAELVCIAAALFYFNPVLTNASKGILPDIYVVLAGVSAVVLWSKAQQQTSAQKNMLYGFYIGLLLAAGVFFKETILVFFVLIVCLAFIYRNRQSAITNLAMLATLMLCGALTAAWYYHYTGNALFRFVQVADSTYYNPCSYDVLPASYIIARLTYQPWRDFIGFGFYPVIFTAALIVYNLFLYKPFSIFKNPFVLCFFILLITGLYFPFSIKGYQPLCGDVRHFLFLLPLAVCAVAPYIAANIENSKTIKWAFICAVIFSICVTATTDKWQWMMWGLFAVYFVFIQLLGKKVSVMIKTFAFAVILWLCMPYQLFYGNSNWFNDMKHLDKELTGSYYYFPDHDNMMHWELLHQFNDSVHCYDLDASPFKIFSIYYEQVDTVQFHPGWFLVNTQYIARSGRFLHTIDSLEQKKYFSRQINTGDMRAMYLQQPAQLTMVKKLTEEDIRVEK